MHNSGGALNEFTIHNHTSGTYFDISGSATASNNAFHFRTVNTNSTNTVGEVMTIQSNGNVGIGNTAPGSLLTVGSASNFTVDSSGNVTAYGASSSLMAGHLLLQVGMRTPSRHYIFQTTPQLGLI